jgi:type IV pilus assembly protein PilW
MAMAVDVAAIATVTAAVVAAAIIIAAAAMVAAATATAAAAASVAAIATVTATASPASGRSGRRPALRAVARGFTLVELMVAMAIGVLIVVAALQMLATARDAYRVNERIARLQEQARTAFAVIEPDIEMAGSYGFTQTAETIRFIQGGDTNAVVASAPALRQFPLRPGDALPAAVSGLPPGAHSCGVNFAIDVSMPVQGSNNRFALGRSPASSCDAYQRRAQDGSDTLTARRVATQTTVAEPSRLQIYAVRDTSRSVQFMFADGNAPAPIDDDHQVHDLVVRTYYVARDSVGRRGAPALRVKSLTRSGTGLIFDEDEVMAGIEDLQVQFGVSVDGSGRVSHYVNPDSPELPAAQVVSVRVWLRVRADEPEPSFNDARTYRYADVEFTPADAERTFRRVLMSRTITLRNARST